MCSRSGAESDDNRNLAGGGESGVALHPRDREADAGLAASHYICSGIAMKLMVHDPPPAQSAVSRTNPKSVLLNILIGYTTCTSTMIFPTSNEDLNLDIQIMGIRNNYCLPEKCTPSKFWSRNQTVNGTEATTVVGEDAEPDQRLQAKILKSDIQTMLIRASQGLPEGRKIPHRRLKIEEVELNTTIMEPYDVIPILCS